MGPPITPRFRFETETASDRKSWKALVGAAVSGASGQPIGSGRRTRKLIRFLDELRRSWTPEHMAGASWVEEGLSTAPTITPLARTTAQSAAAAGRQQVLEVMLRTDD
jgi:hypothetical protein